MTTEEWYHLNNGVRMSLVEVGKQFPVDCNGSTGFFCLKSVSKLRMKLIFFCYKLNNTLKLVYVLLVVL